MFLLLSLLQDTIEVTQCEVHVSDLGELVQTFEMYAFKKNTRSQNKNKKKNKNKVYG